ADVGGSLRPTAILQPSVSLAWLSGSCFLGPVGAAPQNLQTHGHWTEDALFHLLDFLLKVDPEDEGVSGPWEDASLRRDSRCHAVRSSGCIEKTRG
ncbi:unnamed protein product, partial [Gulo gulo]